MFFAKKLISAFLLPSTVSIALLTAGLLVLWLTGRARLGKVLASCGLGLLLLSSFVPLADAFLRPLESSYAPLYPRAALDRALQQAGKPIKWIVVLGGGHVPDPAVPANDQLGDSALSRLVEAIRLQRQIPGTTIVLSGGVGGKVKHADVLAEVAATLGLAPESYVLDRTAWDTEQEAASVVRRIGSDPFVLVTSAVHMPRAMGLFRKAGARPIAAPTQHFTLDVPGVYLGDVFPAPGAQSQVNAGVHEYLGMLWSRLRGRM
jgi:uncharacterized SAM-binding protein YcdF (DUF218 family)